MVYFVTVQDYDYNVRRWIKSLRPVLKCLRCLSYEQLFHSLRAPVGHYIFTDLDRLTHYEVAAAVSLADALRRVDPAVRILNDPRNVLERYPLLRQLEKAGLNRGSAIRLDDGSRPKKYPVFVRCEDDHHGSETGLLHSEEELELALRDLQKDGRVLKRRIAVEFCSQRGDDGYYRKYGAINIGGSIVPQHMLYSSHWTVKGRRKPYDETIAKEEMTLLRENPHRDHLAKVFKIANIDYGRADYGIVDDDIHVFEINTNPKLPLLSGKGKTDQSRERYRIIREVVFEAIKTIDVPLPSIRKVGFSLPEPQYHRMRRWMPIRSSIVRSWRTSERALRKRYPKLVKRIPGRSLIQEVWTRLRH